MSDTRNSSAMISTFTASITNDAGPRTLQDIEPQTQGSMPLSVSDISALRILPGDALIQLFSWLGMEDLISASHVCVQWRTLILATSSLWSTANFTHNHTASELSKFKCVVRRSNQSRIHVSIIAKRRSKNDFQNLARYRVELRHFLAEHVPRLSSLKLSVGLLECGENDCALAQMQFFFDAFQRGREARVSHSVYWNHDTRMVFEIPDMHTLNRVILHRDHLPCALVFLSVTELQLVGFERVDRGGVERIFEQFPNITSLTLDATELPYFEDTDVLNHFLAHASHLTKLSISQPLTNPYPEYALAILNWPVETIQINVTNAGNGYQRQARRKLRGHIMPKSIIVIRCSRTQKMDGTWLPLYAVTLQLREGCSWIFTTDNFPRAMQNFAAPFLRETQVDEVVLDGHAAFAMFYAATRGSALGHIRTIRAVVDGPDSIRVPRQDINVRGLEKIVLETRPEHGSRISASTLAKLVSKLKTDKRPDLYLGDTFVYDDEGTHEIGQYANIFDGQVRKPSWRVCSQ